MTAPSHASASPVDPGRLAAWVVLVGLLVRGVLCLTVVPAWEAAAGVAPFPDQYPALAESLIHDRTLGYGSLGANPTTVRGPGFPLWLTPAVALSDRAGWIALWGSLPGLLVAGLVTGFAARRYGTIAGIVTGGIAALHPLPALIAARGMGDDFYGALGVAALWGWHRASDRDGRGSMMLACVSGGLLAAQMLTRSSGLLTLLVVIGFALMPGRRRLRQLGLLVLVALVPVVAWSIRSSRLEGRPVFVHSMVAYNFWVGEGLDRVGFGDGPAGNWQSVLSDVRRRSGVADAATEGFRYVTLAPLEVAAFETELARQASREIRRRPGAFAARWARGLGYYWYRAQTKTRSLQYLFAALPVLVLAAIGVVRVCRDRMDLDDPVRVDGLFPLMLVAYGTLHLISYAAVLPMARMSVQVYAAVAVLAGIGSAWLWHRRSGESR